MEGGDVTRRGYLLSSSTEPLCFYWIQDILQ